jgi:hypothetical protein
MLGSLAVWRLVLAALLIVTGAASAGAQPLATGNAVRTLLRVKGSIAAVSQGGGAIAWSTWTPVSKYEYCGRVRVREGSSGRRWLLGWETDAPGKTDACTSGDLLIANAGPKVVWGGLVDCCNHHYGAIYLATPGHKRRTLDDIGDDYGAVGRFLVAMTDDGADIVYAMIDVVANSAEACFSDTEEETVECRFRTKSGVVKRIVGAKAVRVPEMPPAVAVDVSSGRVALLPADLRFGRDFRALRRIEVRDLNRGTLGFRVQTRGQPSAVALSDNLLAALTVTGGSHWIESFDAHTGALLRRVAVPSMTADQIDASGTIVVTRSGREIRATRPFAHRSAVLAIARAIQPYDLSMDRGRVIWVESAGFDAKTSRVQMLQLR